MEERDSIAELVEYDRQAFSPLPPHAEKTSYRQRPKVMARPRYQVFLSPSDYAWISKAAGVGAERIALMLWRQVGLRRGRVTDIPLGNDDGYMRIGKDAKRRQLAVLERAGLVTVQRVKGRAPLVTLVGVSGED
jgi:hypothetical protein